RIAFCLSVSPASFGSSGATSWAVTSISAAKGRIVRGGGSAGGEVGRGDSGGGAVVGRGSNVPVSLSRNFRQVGASSPRDATSLLTGSGLSMSTSGAGATVGTGGS